MEYIYKEGAIIGEIGEDGAQMFYSDPVYRLAETEKRLDAAIEAINAGTASVNEIADKSGIALDAKPIVMDVKPVDPIKPSPIEAITDV